MVKETNVLLSEDITKTMICNGTCTYNYNSKEPCEILLSKGAENLNEVFIHECIHNAIFNVSSNPSLEKIAHKLNRREDLIEALASELNSVFKFIIKNSRQTINNKKDDEVTLTTESIHLEPRNTTEEEKRKSVKTDCVDNHVDTPQNCSRQANVADKEDTNNSVLSGDLKSKLKHKTEDHGGTQ